MLKLRIAFAAACAAALYVPVTADAAVSCTFDQAQKQIDVTMTANGNFANVQRNGNQIRVAGAACMDGGTAATVTNTDKVVVTDTSPDGATFTGISMTTGALGPGATAEGDGSSEIEFEVDGDGGSDTLLLLGDDSDVGDEWELGAVPGGSGVNLNAASETALGSDVDVTTSGINAIDTAADDGDDEIVASGPAPFDGPLGIPAELNGDDGADRLVGGGVTDTISGGPGDDSLFGGGGADVLRGEDGRDLVQGSIGADTADYQGAEAGVRVDLRSAQYQDTGGDGVDMLIGVENVVGSDHDDVLTGNNGVNDLDGRKGDDSVTGGGGEDALEGGEGADTLSYATASGSVKVILAQLLQEDANGAIDTALNFENVVGSPFADYLRGNDNANTIEGGAGPDELVGAFGSDTLLARDGEGDAADCGGASDKVVTDLPGVDTLIGCETVDAVQPPAPPAPDQPQPQPEQPAAPGPVAEPAGNPAPALDTTKPVISALRRRGGRLVLRLSEGARITVVVSRRARSRFRKVRRLSRAGAQGTNRIRLPKRLRSGRYRAVLVAVDAAGNRSARRTVRFRVVR
jgi:Ca2+-binding RTX toxin-like protein